MSGKLVKILPLRPLWDIIISVLQMGTLRNRVALGWHLCCPDTMRWCQCLEKGSLTHAYNMTLTIAISTHWTSTWWTYQNMTTQGLTSKVPRKHTNLFPALSFPRISGFNCQRDHLACYTIRRKAWEPPNVDRRKDRRCVIPIFILIAGTHDGAGF